MFISFVLGVVFSVVLFYQRTAYLDFVMVSIISAVTVLLIIFRRYWSYHKTGNFYVGLIIGFHLAFWHSFFQVDSSEDILVMLKNQYSSKVWSIEGEIVEIPQVSILKAGKNNKKNKLKLSFYFKVFSMCEVPYKKKTSYSNSKNKLNDQQTSLCLTKEIRGKPLIKLSDYNASLYKVLPKSSESWRFAVRLKNIHGLKNPGGFDYEAIQFQKGVVARGYVVNRILEPVKLSNASIFNIDTWRELLKNKFSKWWKSSEHIGFYLALTLGEKTKITQQQWEVLKQTGTIHLMAISGLHIGIISGIGFILFGWLWRVLVRFESKFVHPSKYLVHSIPKIYLTVLGAVFLASIYTALAGFSIPTQRAWIMLVAVVIFVFIKRDFQPWSALALAALFVVILHPTSVLNIGFWLSFIAVMLIFSVISHPKVKSLKSWQKVLLIQFVLSVGLLPLLIFYFQEIPSLSFVANLIAIPLVSFLILPLIFVFVILGLLLDGVFPEFIDFVWYINDIVFHKLWEFLLFISQQVEPFNIGVLNAWQVVIVYIFAFYLMLKHKGLKLSVFVKIGIILVLIIFVPNLWKNNLDYGQARFTLLDVGQGLSAVIETKNNVVVYDTGPKWSDDWDGANLAILPFLSHQSIKNIDLLIVSHSDIDHAGGTARLLSKINVKKLVSGQPKKLDKLLHSELSRRKSIIKPLTAFKIKQCNYGQKWVFDGVEFKVLSPMKNMKIKNDNDYSCVLKITTKKQSVLIMGDASKQIEKTLSSYFINHKQKLKADVLFAGHHGSASSTTELWLKNVQPKVVLFASGYKNKFKFPKPSVINRVNKAGADWWNTACAGAVQFVLGETEFKITSIRQEKHKWFSHKCSSKEKGILFQ